MKEKIRASNFELLRMLAMMMVIALHQVGTANALATVQPGDINYYWVHLFESTAICSVNCFILISGYFMIHKTEAPVKKLLSLLVDVAFWGLLGYGLAFLIWGSKVSMKDLVIAVVPYIKGARWFVRDYIILMLAAPFLNILLNRLTKKSYQILLAVLLLFFSVWPSFFPNPPIDDYGYSIVHFVLLYTIAGYMRLHVEKAPKLVYAIGCFLLSVAAIFTSAIFGAGYCYAYNYFFVISAAVSLFMVFRGIRIQSKIINALASGSFDVFVIHTTSFFANLIYVRLFHADTLIFDVSWKYILLSILCPPVFYLFCTALSYVKHWIYRFTVDPLIAWLPFRNYHVEEN